MPTLMTINGTTDQGILLRDALCANWFYQEEIEEGVPNPESKAEFARRMIRTWLKEEVRKYKRNQIKATLGTASAEADAQTEGVEVS